MKYKINNDTGSSFAKLLRLSFPLSLLTTPFQDKKKKMKLCINMQDVNIMFLLFFQNNYNAIMRNNEMKLRSPEFIKHWNNLR